MNKIAFLKGYIQKSAAEPQMNWGAYKAKLALSGGLAPEKAPAVVAPEAKLNPAKFNAKLNPQVEAAAPVPAPNPKANLNTSITPVARGSV